MANCQHPIDTTGPVRAAEACIGFISGHRIARVLHAVLLVPSHAGSHGGDAWSV
jgi:hypothetical protein